MWILKGPYESHQECQRWRADKAEPRSGPCVQINSRADWDAYLATGPNAR